MQTLPREEATALLPVVYEQAFRDKPWIQPYSAAETDALLQRPDDLLFAMRDDEPVGVAWIETGLAGHGRIEPFGIVAPLSRAGLRPLVACVPRLQRLAGT